MAAARAGPIPLNSFSSVSASAVFTLTGPASDKPENPAKAIDSINALISLNIIETPCTKLQRATILGE
jgi:hypothetical protein